MAFQIIKWVTWPLLGWWLYRSLSARGKRLDGPVAEPPGDDLRRVRGIGPGIEAVLHAAGITTWTQLAAADATALRAILDQAGPRYRPHDPATWPAQAAELAAAN